MQEAVFKRITQMRKAAGRVKDRQLYDSAIKSIENDSEFKKLYNMTVQKYLDEDKDPSEITFNEIIDLDFDYFASSYGVKCFAVRNKNEQIAYNDI
ncbi:MAG: hypothetical protein MJ246_05500 [Clostridia bacterium]|nr:hypothetical protein [Clostridia bacterium]